MPTDTTSRIALVTGANKGIGHETAHQLAERGVTVLATAREPERGRRAVQELKTSGADITFLQLDVTDQDSVDQAASDIGEQFGRLDILVNNSGIAVDAEKPPTPAGPFEITTEQMRATYEVNVFGVVAVTRAMLPLLRRSTAARVVNLSSPLGSMALHADPDGLPEEAPRLLAYDTSKTALNAITLHHAHELRDTGILVNAADPGFVATDLNHFAGQDTTEEGAAIVVHLATLDDDGPTGAFLSDDGPVPW